MQLASWKRMVLGALLALSVAGGSLAPAVAGHASADVMCHRDAQTGDRLCWHVD